MCPSSLFYDRIANEILMFFRSSKKLSAEVRLSDPIDSDKDGNCLSLADILSCEDNVDDAVDLKLKIQRLYRYIATSLTDREQQIIQMRYGLCGFPPLTQREVAKNLDISRSYVSRIEKRTLAKLEKEFIKEGINEF